MVDTEVQNGEGTKRRGFAGMEAERQRLIASRGGRAAHQKGTAHEFTADEARAAGYKGGLSVSRDREHMAKIGSRGGKARGRPSQATEPQSSSDTQTNGTLGPSAC